MMVSFLLRSLRSIVRGRGARSIHLMLTLAVLTVMVGIDPAVAQQKIGYYDAQLVLEQIPEYQSVQQKLDRLETRWEQELDTLKQEKQRLVREFEARELLYTEEERKRKQGEIRKMEERIESYRQEHFGPKGMLFQRQKQLMRPIQERILEAVDAVAQREGYDYVFDKSGGDFMFHFARDEYNINEQVLEELGVSTSAEATQSG
jgi:outer membrane protein